MSSKRRTIILNKPATSRMPVQEDRTKPGPVTLRKMTTHPGTSIMVSEALKKLDSRKGVTKQGIQNFIKLNYPSVDPIRLNYLVRRVLLKGLDNGTLVRPTNSTIIAGVAGRFRLAKNKETKAKAENVDPNVQKSPKEAPKTKAVGTKKKPNAAKRKSPKKEAKKGSKKSKMEAEAPPAKAVPTKVGKANIPADEATEEFKEKAKSKEKGSVKTKAKAKEAKSKVEKEPAPKTAAKRSRKKKTE
ncbi:linker histone H1M [Stigmatopora argus]